MIKSLYFILFFIVSLTIQAQINPPPPTCFGPVGDGGTCCVIPGSCGASCPPCTPIPLNNELIILLLVGLSFGSYLIFKNKVIAIKA